MHGCSIIVINQRRTHTTALTWKKVNLQEEKAERKSNNLQEKQQLEDIFWIVGGNSSSRKGHPDYYPYFYFFLRRPKTAAAAKITKPSKGEINSPSDNFYDQYCCQVRHYSLTSLPFLMKTQILNLFYKLLCLYTYCVSQPRACSIAEGTGVSSFKSEAWERCLVGLRSFETRAFDIHHWFVPSLTTFGFECLLWRAFNGYTVR